VYNHIDIKLHPITIQLDSSMISALTGFFKVREHVPGKKMSADKRLDKALGLSAIVRAGVPL
jgi:hypothetical protein